MKSEENSSDSDSDVVSEEKTSKDVDQSVDSQEKIVMNLKKIMMKS